MTLAGLAHLLFLCGLLSAAVLAWRSQTLSGRRLAIFFAALWLLGLVAVRASLTSRGPVWLAAPVRNADFTLEPLRNRPLGTHHQILAPSAEARWPADLDQLRRPFAMDLQFVLGADGAVSDVGVTHSSGISSLDHGVAAAVRRLRFGPLPVAYGPPVSELVTFHLANRYWLLRQSDLAALLACCFVALWALAVSRLAPKAKWEVGSASRQTEQAVRRALLAVGCLASLGWLLVWRLGPDLESTGLALKQAGFLLTGVLLVWLTAWAVWRWHRLGRFVARLGWLWVAGGVLLLLLTRFTPLGTDQNTGHRLWLKMGPLSFQTVELVKILLVLFVAAAAYPAAFGMQLARSGRHTTLLRTRPWWERYRGMIGAFALVLATLTLMSDFGPMLLLALLLVAVLSAQGHQRQSIGGIVLLLLLLGGSYVIGLPSRWRERVNIWRDPWHQAAGDSRSLAQGREHVARVLWATSWGGLAGAGLGAGRPDDVPAVESDFMFTVVAEELGWLGGAAVLALIFCLTSAGLSIAREREDFFEKTLLSGLALLLGVQSAVSIGGNLNFWPLTGITLPFVSYGGSSLLVNFLALGLLVGVAHRPGDLRASAQPLPLDLRRRLDWSLGRLQVVFVVVFALLAAKAAWLQSPWTAGRFAHRPHVRADGSAVANPRLDHRPWVVRGRFLDRDGRVLAETTPRGRRYRDAEHFVHVVGFENARGQRVGLEAYLNNVLYGNLALEGGRSTLSQGREGYDVVLTLDQSLQDRAYQLLRSRGYQGSIVALDPRTGEIVVAADATLRSGKPSLRSTSRPALDPAPSVQQWMEAYNSNQAGAPPFCYRKLYAPGSTFKTLVAAAALDTHTLSPSDTVTCQGTYRAPGGGKPIHDWQGRSNPAFRGHGECTLKQAMIPSCNSIYAAVGVRLGWRRLWEFADRARFNAPIPLIPEELRQGRKDWLETNTSVLLSGRRSVSKSHPITLDRVYLAQTAIGQYEVQMTPLHLALWTAAIANGGRMMAPTVVKGIVDSHGNQKRRRAGGASPLVWQAKPQVLSQVMSETTARQVADMMEQVVTQGTGYKARVAGMRVAGKTGTPQEDVGSSNAIFIAFAPVERPRLAVAVVVENAGSGAAVGPVVAELFRAMGE
jgi:peptidoglycan glycosyltransferase